jgi:ribosome maturation factor RimP
VPTFLFLDDRLAATRDDRVSEMITPTIEAMGYSLVRARLMESQPRRLQVMAERIDRAGMTVDDCATISTAISALLDVEDPIKGHYDLEVSSPGIDRPLVSIDDFARYVGFDAKIESEPTESGRKRFRGRLIGVEDDLVRIDLGAPDGVVAISHAGIRDAKLVMTDELIAASLNSESGE